MVSEEPIPDPEEPMSAAPVEPELAEPGRSEPGRSEPGPACAAQSRPVPCWPDGGTGPDEARWSVARLRWKTLLPELPDDVIALLATPIVVSVDPPGEARRVEDDEEEEQAERYRSANDPYATLRVRAGDNRPRFLAPAGLGQPARARHRV